VKQGLGLPMRTMGRSRRKKKKADAKNSPKKEVGHGMCGESPQGHCSQMALYSRSKPLRRGSNHHKHFFLNMGTKVEKENSLITYS